ncbi:16S rRNA (cytidine(1402)-2'-O)-methyltransferase [Hydrogenophaga defluvii]|uniref:Ribosomal RNA small subunit methyltransferase I n=1 Tax=Hydrogenophaga defluvii TaxID=249410 RepID=A0ABW2SDD6_9BURK
MSAAFLPARSAAEAAAGAQHYPQASVYMVATPIGNLADLSLRALHVLGLVDAIACEDTRHTAGLLQAFGLHKPLLALHQHNEREAAQQVLERLRRGERVAFVSDAGTPGVSDPGARLCAEAQAQGFRCVPVPGASSVTTLLSVAGLTEGEGRFAFVGFLPAKGADRQRALDQLAQQPLASVLLEAPHRMASLAKDLAALGERRLTVGRELTKQFEQVVHLPCEGLAAWLSADASHGRGEFALLLHPPVAAGEHTEAALPPATTRALDLLLQELPLKTAVRLCAEITGTPRNAVYQAALARRQQAGEDDD